MAERVRICDIAEDLGLSTATVSNVIHDTPICEMLRPALTTVRQDGALRAGLAVEKLRELKEGLPVETETMLPVSLVVRNGTAPRRG